MREYDLIAPWYAAARSAEVGVGEVEALADGLPAGARVLDLGCGHGLPLTRLLVRRGLRVVAVDSSPEMAARCEANVPEAEVRCERIQEAAFEPASFRAVLAWGAWFHLEGVDQLKATENVARWLRPGGRFLFTSGAERGVREGEMEGVAFRFVSLGVEGYRQALSLAGLRLDRHHADPWENHVYLAAKA